ncbi:MAG: hypothetical protein M1834_000448 [Cirrosporium novae-zelandiae]|nr:MAG: hypothetical protein M1834_000448 [Cirrosporium novae-zelandiae]
MSPNLALSRILLMTETLNKTIVPASAYILWPWMGYIVVAPDYASLGVGKDSQGNAVNHTYLANPTAANDMFFAVETAQTAFLNLSKQFIMRGHSQGGGAA